MDDVVRQAMSKWPDVPHVYGWLVFDRRGQWRVRNEYAQQHGLSGDPVRHEALARALRAVSPLEPAYSFLSLTEVSEYMESEDDVRAWNIVDGKVTEAELEVVP